MADEKPFEPTPSRLARARRDGDLPRSSDVNAIASLGAASLGLFGVLGVATSATRAAFAMAASGTTPAGPCALLALACGAVVVCGSLGALAATFAQARTLAFKFPTPKFAKLDPVAGLKRMCSRDAALGGTKAFVVAVAATAAVAPSIREAFASPTTGADGAGLAELVLHALRTMLASALAVAALFACGDVALERAKWRKRLRMSFEDLRRDSKSSDGDPLVRGRRRAAHRALVRGSIGRVAEAAFVVANPTHVAIALSYRPPEVAIPCVLVRAVDAGAREVKRRARALGIPIVENVALARTLLAATDIGDAIPPETYAPVAAIVAMLARGAVA